MTNFWRVWQSASSKGSHKPSESLTLRLTEFVKPLDCSRYLPALSYWPTFANITHANNSVKYTKALRPEWTKSQQQDIVTSANYWLWITTVHICTCMIDFLSFHEPSAVSPSPYKIGLAKVIRMDACRVKALSLRQIRCNTVSFIGPQRPMV